MHSEFMGYDGFKCKKEEIINQGKLSKTEEHCMCP